jgi:hypothetical protein
VAAANGAAGGWRSTSAGNDVRLIREVLALQGFAPQHITVLADGGASKAAITGALDALIAAARRMTSS